jgi:acyl-CoA thioester hydrolase
MLLHVDLAGPSSAPFSEQTLGKLQAIVAAQADLPTPAYIGRVIALPPKK